MKIDRATSLIILSVIPNFHRISCSHQGLCQSMHLAWICEIWQKSWNFNPSVICCSNLLVRAQVKIDRATWLIILSVIPKFHRISCSHQGLCQSMHVAWLCEIWKKSWNPNPSVICCNLLVPTKTALGTQHLSKKLAIKLGLFLSSRKRWELSTCLRKLHSN